MKTRWFFFALIFPSIIFSQTINLKIVETSDVHGVILPIDFTQGRKIEGTLSRVDTYLKVERANPNQEVILLDNGDILQGDPGVYYYNYENTEAKHFYAEAMNNLKYDAATVGNHDIETGHAVYDRFRKEINFPWMAANAIDTKNNKPYFEPYTIIERQGIKIAVLGLITPGIPNWLPYKLWEGIKFEDKIKTAKEWVPKILKNEKPDLLIGLFHAGVDYSYDGGEADSDRNENASKLVAQQVPGFDIIFVGHDHQSWNFWETSSDGSKVLILGPNSRAQNVAVANVRMVFNTEKQKWSKSLSGEIVDLKEYLPDPALLFMYKKQHNEIRNYVSKEIGTLAEDIDSKYALFEDAAFTDLIHNIQLELTGADISFTAPLSINAVIKKGPLYVRDMFNLYHYENLLLTMEFSGKEIDEFLEYSYGLWFGQMNSRDDDLLLFVKDEKGNTVISERYKAPLLTNRYYNFDSAEGIEYTVDVSKPVGNRVSITSLSGGREFSEDQLYKVAVNSYRGNGGGGHFTRGVGLSKEELTSRVIDSTEKDLRYYIMKWIENKGNISPAASNNWKVIPESWYSPAKERDFKLMYGQNN